MTKILLLVAGDNGTIGSCSLNLYEALKEADNIDVKCAIVHHFENGYSGLSDAEFFDKEHKGWLGEHLKWLRAIKKEFQPDVTISTLFAVSTLSVLSGGKDKKIGIFHSPHQQVKSRGHKTYLLSLLQYHLIFSHLDKLCCVSQEVYNSLAAFPFIPTKKKHVVYNVHNLKHVRDLASEEILTDNEKQIFSNPTLLYCGRLDKNKAPDRALKAFAGSDIHNSTQLVYMGEDQQGLTEQLLKEAESLRVKDRTHFLGKKNNPYPYFNAAKALISSSYSEGLPGVIIEALALRKPVVTTNSSMGVWEIFSCLDDYNQRLTGIYETPYGVISSNLSHLNQAEFLTDILNLSQGIEIVFNRPEITDFEFENKVNGQTIIQQLLSNL